MPEREEAERSPRPRDDDERRASEPRSPLRTCPNCGAELSERSCKLTCPNPACGYFLSCSDYL